MPSNRQSPSKKERAARNMSQLAGHIKWMNISAETIVKMADADGNRKLNVKEFSLLTTKLNFKFSEEEIGELFAIINTNNNGIISVEELAAFLK